MRIIVVVCEIGGVARSFYAVVHTIRTRDDLPSTTIFDIGER